MDKKENFIEFVKERNILNAYKVCITNLKDTAYDTWCFIQNIFGLIIMPVFWSIGIFILYFNQKNIKKEIKKQEEIHKRMIEDMDKLFPENIRKGKKNG